MAEPDRWELDSDWERTLVNLTHPYRPRPELPSILHVCQESRIIARRVYTILPYKDRNQNYNTQHFAYFNTLYDVFCVRGIGPPAYSENPTLKSLLLPELYADSENFSTMRHIRVNFAFLIAIPVKYWLYSFHLETLTIVMYMRHQQWDKLGYEFGSDWYDHDTGTGPRLQIDHESKYGKRMMWSLQFVQARLQRTKADNPDLHLPHLDVDLMVDPDLTDVEVQEGVKRKMISKNDEGDNDSEWYKKAIAHCVDEIQDEELSQAKVSEMWDRECRRECFKKLACKRNKVKA